MKRPFGALLLLLFATAAFAFLRSVDIGPVKASWSGKVWGDPQYGGIAQTFTANFDSVAYCELFIGDVGDTGHHYNADIYEYPDGIDPVASAHNVAAPARGHVWLKFELQTPTGQKFARGKHYLVSFTRPDDSIQFYYNCDDPYPYGEIPNDIVPNPADLCVRLFGKARVGNEFGVHSNIVNDRGPADMANWQRCIEREAEVGVQFDKVGYGFWPYVQPSGPSDWDWDWMDSLMTRYCATGVRPVMSFRGPALWATCAEDWDNNNHYWQRSGGAIPRGLWAAVVNGSQPNDSNYYAKFIFEFVRRYGPLGYTFSNSDAGTFWRENPGIAYLPITLYEGFPEVPAGGIGDTAHDSWKGYWRLDMDPGVGAQRLTDAAYRDTLECHIEQHGTDTLAARKSSLLAAYARLVIVVDSAVKLACATPADSSDGPRSAAYITDDGKYGMDAWLAGLQQRGVGSFFDVASYFGYHNIDPDSGDPCNHASTLNWLRDELRRFGMADKSFWITEFGTTKNKNAPVWDQVNRASHLLKSFAWVQAANAQPGPPAEACAWFTFTKQYMHGNASYWNIIGDAANNWPSWPPAYAYRQWSDLTRNASYEGQLVPTTRPWDTAYVGSFQFADSTGRRFWTVWRPSRFVTHSWRETLQVPLRTDTADTFSTATTSTVPSGTLEAATDGWAVRDLDSIPLIIVEQGTRSRPDLATDSVRVRPLQPWVGRPCTLYAYARNHGNRQPDLATRVRFAWNGDTLCRFTTPWDTTHDETHVFAETLSTTPAWMHGPGLLSAEVNPGQEFVELGMDDNTGYYRTVIRRPPEGDIEIASQDGRTNLPIVPVALHTESKERDTTGNTPADSARLIQLLLLNDTTVLAAETSAWFSGAVKDTVVQFLLGQGRHRIQLEVCDSGDNYSLPIEDTQHPVVLFDSTSATGTLDLNLGARFINTQTCSLALAASDSTSGVRAMRIGNKALCNLVQNSGFGSDAGWTFAGGGMFDNGLDMALLPAKPDSVTSIWQLIPEDSLESLLGDSLRFSADLLICPDSSIGDTLGWLSFEYCYYDDSASTTAWTEVAAAPVWDTIAAFAGLGPLAVRFVLPDPAPQAGQTWLGGRVVLGLSPHDGQSGTAWLDNVRLEQVGPAPDYTDWQPYDSLSTWDIGAAPGEKVVSALLCDSSGNESQAAVCDTVVFDPTPPLGAIIEPKQGSLVSGKIDLTGFAYDSIEVQGQCWFESYRLYYMNVAGTARQPVSPDSVSYQPVYGNPKKPQPLGTWNATGLQDGEYYLYLVVTDSAGSVTEFKTWVTLENWISPGKTGSGPTGGEVSLNSSGDVFVGSATGRVVQLDEELDSLAGFVFTDSGQNAYVAGITELDSTHLLATDLRTGDITKMTKQGTDKQELIQNLDLPVAVATDASGNIWTLDKGESQLYKHLPDGTLALTIGSPGQDSTDLSDPEAFTIRDSLAYIADTRNDRIAVYDTAGTLIELIQGEFQEPCAIAVTSDNRLYIVDKTAGTIEGLNSQGGHLLTIAAEDSAPLRQLGTTEDQLSLVTLKPGTGDILQYEVQSEDSIPGGVQSGTTINLPQSFTMDQPRPNPMRSTLTISYAIPRPERVTVTVHDITGRRTRTVADQPREPGYYRETWDRTDSHRRTVPNGVYFVEVRTQTQSDRKKVVLTN
jgi:hypothetical protein